MSNKSVSIIVPVYNTEDYVEECILSVLKQKNDNWQLILVNDGSLDKSGDICKKYAAADERILYIEQSNGGVSVARNNGIKHASGDWLTFLDSDDCLSEDALSLVNYVPDDCDVIVAGFSMVKDSYFFESEGKNVEIDVLIRSILNYCQFTKKYPYGNTITEHSRWGCCERFYRRTLICDNNLEFVHGIRLGEDLLFCLNLYKYATRAWVNNSVIYYYRENPNSATRVFRTDRIENTKKLLTEVYDVAQELKREDEFKYFAIDRLSKCCSDYYGNKACGMTVKDASVELKALCEIAPVKYSIENCGYKGISFGKRNALYSALTLFCTKHKMYKLLVRLFRCI